jgi:predicted ATPase
MVKLKQVRVRNYKAFEDTTFVPDESGLTVVIGSNGSGKTSLWEVLSLLSRLANGWQVSWLGRQFSGRGRTFVGCLPWHESERELNLQLRLSVGRSKLDSEVDYEVGWSPNPETGQPQLTTESLVFNGKELLRFDSTTGRYDSKSPVQWHFLEKNYPLVLSSIGRQALANTKYSLVREAFEDVAKWGVYRFRVLDLGKDLRDLDIASEPRDSLTLTGDNLAVVLHAWKESPDIYPFAELQSAIRVMLQRAGLDEVQWDVRTEVAGGSVYAFVRFSRPRAASGKTDWFDLAFGPDGFKAYFQLMTALLHPSPLTVIEEPESHLEPRLLDLLGSQLATTAGSGRQVIVTTHSPFLAQLVPIDSVRVLRAKQFDSVPPEVRDGRDLIDAWLTDILHEPSTKQ